MHSRTWCYVRHLCSLTETGSTTHIRPTASVILITGDSCDKSCAEVGKGVSHHLSAASGTVGPSCSPCSFFTHLLLLASKTLHLLHLGLTPWLLRQRAPRLLPSHLLTSRYPSVPGLTRPWILPLVLQFISTSLMTRSRFTALNTID